MKSNSFLRKAKSRKLEIVRFNMFLLKSMLNFFTTQWLSGFYFQFPIPQYPKK